MNEEIERLQNLCPLESLLLNLANDGRNNLLNKHFICRFFGMVLICNNKREMLDKNERCIC